MTGKSIGRWASIATLAVALTTGFAQAQEATESHLAAARDAIRAIDATNQFDPILPQAAEALRSELIQKDPNLQAEINRIVDEQALALASRRADLETEAARIYARSFTEDELKAIAAFYNGEAGKKLIAEGPIVTRELLKAAGIWQQGIARDLAETVGGELQKVAPSAPAEPEKTGN